MTDTHSNSGTDNGTNVVAIVALIILAGLVVLFFMYGLPMLQNASGGGIPSEIKVELPSSVQSAPKP